MGGGQPSRARREDRARLPRGHPAGRRADDRDDDRDDGRHHDKHDRPHGNHGGGRMTRLRQSRLGASLDGHRRRHELASVEAFCIFIGYPRSCHSLLGSLLDAHPEMVIAHELDVLTFVAAGWPRRALYSRILNHDATFTESGRQWFGYDYRVPGQWQGRVSKLRVIGDKKGGKTTERLGARPDLLERLRHTVEVPVRLV